MELMTVNAYAERIGCPASTIRSMCKANVLPSCKIGVAWRIDALGADEYFKAKIASRSTVVKVAPKTAPRPSKAKSFLEKLSELEKL